MYLRRHEEAGEQQSGMGQQTVWDLFHRLTARPQVFFIDTSGALCSRSSGHAIDVESAWTCGRCV